MTLPRVRLTVRRLMVVVVIVSLWLGLSVEIAARLRRRAARFHAEAEFHVAKLNRLGWQGSIDNSYWTVNETVSPTEKASWESILWHSLMAAKYTYAARFPWWPVDPDPPEPE